MYGGSQDGSGRIVAQQLTKVFGPVTAVREMSFTVEPGTVTGFLGPNGAGKTTTLRMLVGLVRPTSGLATINGLPFDRLRNPARVVGALLEAQGFHPSRTARAHLLVYAAAIGAPDQRVEHVLQLVGLDAAGNRKVGGYSLGMRQRLALATALLGDPRVLILDEPSNGLDPEGIAWLRTFIRGFAASGRTVLISSHILAEIEQTIDHVVIISQGQSMYNGPLDDLRRRQQARVLVRTSNTEALASALREDGVHNFSATPDGRLAINSVTGEQVADIALRAGIALSGVEEEHASLEQLYFQLTTPQFASVPAGYGAPQPGYGPPPQAPGYAPPGYAPPGYGQTPPPGWAPPAGYTQPGYQQPGYAPPQRQTYAPPPGYAPPGYAPPPPPQPAPPAAPTPPPAAQPTQQEPTPGQQYPALGYTPEGLPAQPGSTQPGSTQQEPGPDAEGRA